MDFDDIPLSKADHEDKQRQKRKLQEANQAPKKVHEINSSDSDGLTNEHQEEVIFQGNRFDSFPSKYNNKAPIHERADEHRESSSLSDASSVFGDNSQRDKSSDINKLNFGYLSRFFQRVAERKGKQKSE